MLTANDSKWISELDAPGNSLGVSPDVEILVAEIQASTDAAAKPFQDMLATLNLASQEAYDVRDHLIGVFNSAASRLENIATSGEDSAYVNPRIGRYRAESARLQEIQGGGRGVPSELMPVALTREKQTSWLVPGLIAVGVGAVAAVAWFIWRK